MKTLLTLASAPLLAASMLVAAPAVADAPTVTAQDLPSAKQLRAIYPSTKASTYMNEPNVSVPVVKSCKRVVNVRAKKSRMTGITGPSKNAPLAFVTVSEMKTAKAARQVIAGQRRTISCKTVVDDGVSSTSKGLSAPRLGQERVGLTGTYFFEDGSSVRSSEFYFRDGKRVVEVAVLAPKAQHGKARRLAKLAYRLSR